MLGVVVEVVLEEAIAEVAIPCFVVAVVAVT
jgi:hypothetical protein